MLSKNRVGGVDPGWVGDLARLVDVVLVEADGSRRRPIKGTADHEPALPDAATLVVAVGNVHALGTPVDEEHVHRPEVFSDLTGIGPGPEHNPERLRHALAQGSLARVPQGARTAALITGVEPGRSMSDASVITRELWRLGVKNVVLASLPTAINGPSLDPVVSSLTSRSGSLPKQQRRVAGETEHLRWTLRAEPDGPAPSRKPANSASGVAVRAFGRGAVSGTGGGPRPLAGAARGGGGTALRSPVPSDSTGMAISCASRSGWNCTRRP